MKRHNQVTLALVGLTLLATAAYAQWQGCNHCVPIGKGPGVTGFSFATPSATSGVPVVSQGSSVDPAFGTVVVAGGGTGQVTLATDGILVGNGTGGIISNRCAMNSASTISCTSSTSFNPNPNFTNTASDANASTLQIQKNRAGGNTLNGDRLGTILIRGFANSAQQNTAAIVFDQIAASSGSNIPSTVSIQASNASGQLNASWSFDGNAKNFNNAVGGSTAWFGSSSGFTTLGPQATAGNNALVLPTVAGTLAISAGATAPLSVNATTGAIGFSGMSSNGLLYASSATAVATDRCSMDGNQATSCSSSTAFTPQYRLNNNTSDANSAYFIIDKSRSGGNTNSADTLGNWLARGFANGGFQNSAALSVRQSGASSGSNIPSAIDLSTSTTAGQLLVAWGFDGPAKRLSLPAGGDINFVGSSSGSAAISVPAAAGTPATLQLPTTSGSSGQVLSTNGSGVLSWATASGITPDIQVFTTPGANTWNRTSGVTVTYVKICGGGGGGGGGARQAAGTASAGGGGGGGAYCSQAHYKSSDVGASQTVTVGAAGTAGTGATVNGTAGTAGSAGGSTTFGTLLSSFGGGGGGPGGAAAAGGGGGGGGGASQSSGAAGGSGTGQGGGSQFWGNGVAAGITNTAATPGPCAGGSAANGTPVLTDCPFGGSGGAAATSSTGTANNGGNGGSTSDHGPGGGAGGNVATTNATSSGGFGGKSWGCPTAPAGSAGSNLGVAGGSTAANFNYLPGCGGGGGGSGNSATAGAGGAGTSGGGGGGGGGGNSSQNGGAGGTGGAGFAVVISWLWQDPCDAANDNYDFEVCKAA